MIVLRCAAGGVACMSAAYPKLGPRHTVEAQLLCCLQPSVFFGMSRIREDIVLLSAAPLAGVMPPEPGRQPLLSVAQGGPHVKHDPTEMQ